MSDSSKGELFFGIIFWIVIIAIGYWYWHCADGVRAVETAHCYELLADEIAQSKGIKNQKDYYERQNYDISKTFEEAIEDTNPSTLLFKPIKIKGKKAVAVSVVYDTPWKGLDKFYLVMAVEKRHFWNFNPICVAPIDGFFVNDGQKYQLNLHSETSISTFGEVLFNSYFLN